MKKFAGNKPLIVIKRQCEEAGIQFDDRLYREHGSDFIVIRSIKDDSYSGEVLYNTVNGKFFGTTPDAIVFDSCGTEHEDQSWFQALLSFFYVELEAEVVA